MKMPTVPPPPSRRKARVAEMVGLGRYIGGAEGRRLISLAIQAANGPDLTIHTRKPVSSQAAAVLNALGQFKPDDVSIQTMKRMRLDPQIQLALAATKAPIMAAPVFFESTSREAIALCEAAWMETGILRELQRTSLNAIDFGFSAHEKIWEAVENFEVQWSMPGKTVGVMSPQTKTYPLAFLPKKAKDLDPALVTLLSDEFGRFQGLVHGAVPATVKDLINRTNDVLMPEKCFLFTLNEEFGNIYGRARQVAAYDPWYWQRILYLATNRWYETKADPVMVGFAPSDPMLLDPGTDETEYDEDDPEYSPLLRMRRLMRDSIRGGGIMVLPSEPFKDDNGKPSTVRAYDVKELGTEDVHPAFLAYHQHLDAKKTRAMLVPDGAIAASENSGTYGSTKTLSELAISIQNETLNGFIRHFNRYQLAPFLAYNGIKDRVTARTTGISSDSRDVLLKLAEKTYEADMLLEQAWGPQFPDSLTRLISRRRLLRSLNIPFEEPDPDAPAPELPTPPPQPEGASQGGDKSKGKAKKKTGLSARKEKHPGKRRDARPFRLAAATQDFESWAVDAADAFETQTDHASERAPYRDVISAREKAVAAILLWFLLRADKIDKKGKKRQGSTMVDEAVFETASRHFLPADRLAEALPQLEAMAADFEGKGFRIASTAKTRAYMKRAEDAITGILDVLPDDLAEVMEPTKYLTPAIEAAHVATRNLMARFDSLNAGSFVALDEAARDEILTLNERGLIWNIQNIGIRNTRSAIERMMNSVGNKRMLGAVNDAASTRFNLLYTDLSLEAHYRACFRAAMAELAQANGYTYLLMVSPRSSSLDTGSELSGTVRTAEEWDNVAESYGQPNAIRQFGFHPGSKSYWFPVPNGARIRPGAELAIRYLSGTREQRTVDTPRG